MKFGSCWLLLFLQQIQKWHCADNSEHTDLTPHHLPQLVLLDLLSQQCLTL